MTLQSLNGKWLYRIGKGKQAERTVPFSALAVGHSECERRFDLDRTGDKIFLGFDGITYYAKVFLNDVYIGEMLPYCEYRFDVSNTVKSRENVLRVELEDISPDFGPSEGWENFGGIIRDVSLIYYGKAYIEDIFFHSTPCDGYKNAEFTVETSAICDGEFEYEITLRSADGVLISYTQNKDLFEPHKVENITLWSPDSPFLYALSAILKIDGNEVDRYECKVGFREITNDGHVFLLNGMPLFLHGVCKHEMVGNSGHSPTYEQIENDLMMIKELGCNFVRLVHYPHNKATLEIADRIGLLVSEEPGLWWSDTSNPSISAGSLEVLRRTIYRDRNHASIAFWLCFNECIFTEQFLIDSARVCRECDPTRMVSGANCMSNEDTLKYYKLCNFDFYTMHPYSQTFDKAKSSAEILCDKPLLFTEWGGYYVYDNPHLITDFINGMAELNKKNMLAGAFFWCFAEIREFNRGRPACIDGVLSEGLVKMDRQPTTILEAYRNAWKDAWSTLNEKELYEYKALETLNKKPIKLPIQKTPDDLIAAIEARYPKNRINKRPRVIKVGPLLQKEELEGLNTIPYVLGDGDSFEVTCGSTDCVTLLGLTALQKGYPLGGEYGEEVAEVILKLNSGNTKKFTLKNGIDVTTALTTLCSSRIDPRAENATRFAEFSYEKNFEQYIINRLDLDLGDTAEVEKLTVKSLGNGYRMLIYGIYI